MSISKKIFGSSRPDERRTSVAVGRYLGELKSPDSLIRESAANALGEAAFNAICGNFSFPSQFVAPALIESLKDNNSSVRAAAAKALGEIGSSAKLSIPGLVQILTDNDPNARYEAAKALGCMRLAALSVVPDLLQIFEDSDYGVQVAVLNALGKILISAMEDNDSDVRLIAVKTATKIKNQDGSYVFAPLLERARDDKDDRVRSIVMHLSRDTDYWKSRLR